MSNIVTSNGTNAGNGNFELGSTAGWSLAHTALTSNLPSTDSVPGQTYVTGQYIFTVTSANATAGATYTNNSHTFTVVDTIAAGTILVTTGTGAPTSSGTLTKASGTGDATITFSVGTSTTATGPVTITTVSSGQLNGAYSLDYASTGITQAGDMLISSPTFINKSDQSQVINFSFLYSVITNAGLNFSGTSANSYGIAIYDVTNGAWIIPVGVWSMNQISGTGTASGSFQAPSNMTAFQIAVFDTSAISSGPVTIYFDNFSAGPQVSGGASISAVAMSATGSTTSINGTQANITWTTTVKDTNGAFNGTTYTVPVSGLYFVSTQLRIDATYTAIGTGAEIQILQNGTVKATDLPVAQASVTFLTPQVAVLLSCNAGDTIKVQASSSGTSPSIDSGTDNNLFSVFMVGGGSSAGASSGAVVAQYYLSTATAVAGSNPVKFNTVIVDTNASYSTSTGLFTAPVSGVYDVKFSGYSTSGTGVVYVSYNGGSGIKSQDIAYFGGTSQPQSGSCLVSMNAGDTVQINPATSITFAGGSTNDKSMVSFELTGGGSSSSSSASANSVNARYTTSNSQSISNATETVITTWTVDFDSNAAMNASSGVYTAPVSGKYLVVGFIQLAAAVYVVGAQYSLTLQKNGSDFEALGGLFGQGTPTALMDLNGSALISLNAGDTINLAVFQTSGGSRSLSGTASANYFAVTRIGN